MRLAIVLICLTLLYIPVLIFFLRETKKYDKEQLFERRTYPLIFVTTALYIALVVKITSFTMKGILPLL